MPRIQIAGIRLVALDLDDTLYPETSFVESGFEAVGRWLKDRLACPIDPVSRLKELFQTAHRPRAFNQLLVELSMEPADELVTQMINVYRRHQPRITLFEDAARALDRWKGHFRLALISDGPLVSQQNKVAALGLTRWLDEIILTDAWGPDYWKPHTRAYETLQRTGQCQNGACIYIGDNASKDFVAPVQLGWQTIQVCRPDAVHINQPAPPLGLPRWQAASLDDIHLTQ